MSRIIDADSHFMEPLDLWQRYIEPQYRDRCLRFARRPDKDRYMILVEEDTRLRFNVEDLLGVLIGFGQKEAGVGLGAFDLAEIFSPSLEDMNQRIRFLDPRGNRKPVPLSFHWPSYRWVCRRSRISRCALPCLQ